jgi:hypothetical protein
MSSFVRLQDGEGNDTERLLLASASDDIPSPGAREKTLVALGMVSAAAIAPGAVHAAVHVASSGAAAKSASSMTVLALTKWLGTGAAMGAFTAACIATATTPGLLFPARSNPVVASSPAPTPPKRAVARAPIPERIAAPEALEEPKDTPAAASATALRLGRNSGVEDPAMADAPGASARSYPGSVGNANNVLAEVASLDRARAALAAGDARSAIDRLTVHERRFPGGTLTPEAVVLRVRAWLELGQRAEAVALVNEFLKAHPESSQSARLRALVGIPPR